MRDAKSGFTIRSSVTADHPACIDDRPRVYAVVKNFATSDIAVLTLPDLLQEAQVPASIDLTDLTPTSEGQLLALNANPRASTIESIAPAGLEPGTSTNSAK
jgi:hypothetical protein